MCTKIAPLLFLFVLHFADGRSQDNPLKLRVMTYNTAHANPDRAASVIRKYNPDIVALQEIDKNNGRSGRHTDQAKEIAEKLGMSFQFFKAIGYADGEYGIAILSKYPIKSTQKTELPGAGEHRVMGAAYIDLGHGKEMVFACTHMDPDLDANGKIKQIKTIVDALADDRVPVVLAGDLNCQLDTPMIDFLDQYYTRACTCKCLPSCPNPTPFEYIDHIAFRKADPFTFTYYDVPNEVSPSDHRPVLAELFLKLE